MMDALSTRKVHKEAQAKIDRWLRYIRADIVGTKRRAVYKRIPLDWMTVDKMESIYHEPEVETEDMLVIEVPVKEIATMEETQDWYRRNIGGFDMKQLDHMVRDKHHEEFLRKEHPGLQEAWEQYQIMLKLCSTKTY